MLRADLPVDVAKALGPANLKALSTLESPAVLRTLGLQASDGGPGLAAAAADGVMHAIGTEDSSDEGVDSEDLEYAMDAPCTNCTGRMYDGYCQVSCSLLDALMHGGLLQLCARPVTQSKALTPVCSFNHYWLTSWRGMANSPSSCSTSWSIFIGAMPGTD